MNKKEIFASIEVADHEVRIVVGEFYETRFNILRVEKAPIKGIENQKIMNEQDIINGIIKAKKQAEDALGYHIERVLVAIPSVHVERHNKRVSVIPEASSKRIRLSDIQRGLNEAVGFKPSPEKELVNIGCIKYITNGITSRKMPIDEVADVMLMNVDLLYADKEIVYAYARCVERAGLEILDVCLDSYAMANEAAVFEQTVDKYVIQVDLARHHTTLTLFTHGKLVNCELLDEGYGSWLQELMERYQFTENVSYRLAQNTCTFDVNTAKDQVIYIWSQGGEQKQITEREVCEAIVPYAKNWVDLVNETCAPIVESGDVRYLISGEGCEIPSMQQLLPLLNAPAQIYIPQTIGARDCSYVTCLGLFYSWKEQMEIRRDERVCCNPLEVEKTMNSENKKSSVDEEGGFTKKLKSILLSDK